MINTKAPEFYAKAFHENKIKEISLSDYRGKWVFLFFYPADFSLVCPTELLELINNQKKFKEIGAEILIISTDSEFVHRAWHENSEELKNIRFPMVADPSGKICKAYNTYNYEEGLSFKATYIINPEGIIKYFEMNDNSIGRDVNEMIRKIKSLKFSRENKKEFCFVIGESKDEKLKSKFKN